jgi:selenide, water dikinase
VIDPESIPALNGALPLLAAGITSSLHAENIAALSVLSPAVRTHEIGPLLIDPQTAGGLLAGVPAALAASCLTQLHELGYRAAVIGRVAGVSGAEPRVDFERGAAQAPTEPVAAK